MGRTSRKSEVDYAAAAKKWAENNKDGRKPTMKDVAALAGVSKKTVSRVINESPLVNEATRKGIQGLIKEIGYRPDPQARGLASRRSYLVGMIYDNPTPQYVVNIQLGILDVLRNTGFELVVHPCDRKSDTFIEDAQRFIEVQKLYGVILTPSVSEDERLQLFETLREFTGIANEIGEVVTSTTLPLCHPPPRVLFDGCRFCFTGTFVFGSRRTCHEASCERGATVGGIAKSTDFLVIGAYATESWQHSSYGRKIEKAVAFRDSGVPISIISERHGLFDLSSIT